MRKIILLILIAIILSIILLVIPFIYEVPINYDWAIGTS